MTPNMPGISRAVKRRLLDVFAEQARVLHSSAE